MFADVNGELLGSAPSLDVWNMTGIRRGQADPGVSELATSSSSGLGVAPCACPLLCAVPFVPFALLPLCPLLCCLCALCSAPIVPLALYPLWPSLCPLCVPFALPSLRPLLCPLVSFALSPLRLLLCLFELCPFVLLYAIRDCWLLSSYCSTSILG